MEQIPRVENLHAHTQIKILIFASLPQLAFLMLCDQALSAIFGWQAARGQRMTTNLKSEINLVPRACDPLVEEREALG